MIRDVQLWIDGKYIDLELNNIRLNSLTPWAKDEVPSFMFSVESMHVIAEDPWINKTVALFIDDGTVTAGYKPPVAGQPPTAMPDPVDAPWWNLVFLGQCNRRTITNGDLGWVYGYEALGVDYLASQWPIVSPFDGTGTVTFNLAASDPNYDSAYTGLSVGEMILMLLEEASTAAHFDELARRVDPKDKRYTGIALGKYEYVTDPINRSIAKWTIDARTRKDIMEDGYLGTTTVNGTASKVIPTLPVLFNGDDWLQGVRAVIQAWAPNHVLWIEPVFERLPGDGLDKPKRPIGIIRIADTAKDFAPGVKRNPAKRVDMNVKEHPLPTIQRNYQQSFSRLVVRGGPDVQPVVLKLSKGELIEDFKVAPFTTNDAAKAAWNLTISTTASTKTYNGSGLCRRPRIKAGIINEIDPTIPDPNNPNLTIVNPGYVSDITSTALKSGSSFLVQSANEVYRNPTNGTLSNIPTSWANHLLSQNSDGYGGTATMMRINTVAGQPQWQISDTRAIVDNTAYPDTGGGVYFSFNATLSTDDATQFKVTTQRWPGFATWRRYKINKFMPDGTNVAKRVQAAFPVATDWKDEAGQIVRSGVTKGSAYIIYKNGNATQTMEWDFVTDRQTEHIIFGRPTVMAFGDQANLTIGGANTTGIPNDIWVFVPVSGKAMEVVIPSDTKVANATNPNLPTITPVYQGTSYSEDKLERTKYVNDPQWVSWTDQDIIRQWGTQLLASVQDTIVEGHAPILGYRSYIGWGWWMNWQDDCPGTDTPLALQRMTSDIRGCTITWNHGNAAVPIQTDVIVSNRRDPYASQTPMVYHPCMYQGGAARQQTISWGSDSFAFTQSDAISKFTTDLDNQITSVQTNLSVKMDSAAGAAEVRRLREAGLDAIISKQDLGLEAAEMSGQSAQAAQMAGEWAAKNDQLDGPGQGYSNNFHTAAGDIGVGYGLDGNDYMDPKYRKQ